MKAVIGLLMAIPLTGVLWAGPVDKEVDAILADYFTIQTALAQDATEGTAEAAKSIQRKASAIQTSNAEVRSLVQQITTAAAQFKGQDLEAARNQFFEISKPLMVYLQNFHHDKDNYHRYYCSMAKKGWIQPQKATQNPYFGQSMATCGEAIQ